jgi:hypothetical protein
MIKMIRIEVYQKRARLFHRLEQASLDDSPYGGSLPLSCELMRQFQHLSYWVVLAFQHGGGCMFLIDCVNDGDPLVHTAQIANGIMVDIAEELLQDVEGSYESHHGNTCSDTHYVCMSRYLVSSRLSSSRKEALQNFLVQTFFSSGVRRIACETAFETRNNYSVRPSTSSSFALRLRLSCGSSGHIAGCTWGLRARSCVLVQATWNEPF